MDQCVDVGIIGGGFAGLAAALRLHQAGVKICLIEKRPFLGGRAYSFFDRETGEWLDNGQHLFMGSYHESFIFLERLGVLGDLDIQPSLDLIFSAGPDRFYPLKCPDIPSPFHLIGGLLRWKALKLPDKCKIAKLIYLSDRPELRTAPTVLELLRATRQTQEAINFFWEPLTLATLNDSIEVASASLLLEVLRRSFRKTKTDSSLAVSKVDLSALYAEPAKEYLQQRAVPLFVQTQIVAFQAQKNMYELVTHRAETIRAKNILFAIPPNALHKLLAQSGDKFARYGMQLTRFSFSPIISVYLWIEDFHPKEKMVGFIDSPVHWMFNRAKLIQGKKSSHFAFVISGAYRLLHEKKESILSLVFEELRRYYPELREKRLLHAKVVKEAEATFSPRNEIIALRPGARTGFPGIFLAGDWVNTGLPATIESAVCSGHKAADAILERV